MQQRADDEVITVKMENSANSGFGTAQQSKFKLTAQRKERDVKKLTTPS